MRFIGYLGNAGIFFSISCYYLIPHIILIKLLAVFPNFFQLISGALLSRVLPGLLGRFL